MEYGIKYYKVKLNQTTYILVPIKIIEGYSVNGQFYSDKIYPYPQEETDYQKDRVVIDGVLSDDDLKKIYEMDDIDFLKNYYFTEEQEHILIVEVKNGQVNKKRINIKTIQKSNDKEEYSLVDEEGSVILNDVLINKILTMPTIQDIRRELKRIQKSLHSIKDFYAKDGVTKISIENGKITEIQTEYGVKQTSPEIIVPKIENSGIAPVDSSEISVEGLENYIKERIFGHDDEIRDIATILIMNYYSTKEFGTESILIPGPTGTGKTATFNVASEYLNLPFIPVNTINLVPQGIKGTSLEDVLFSLLRAANFDQQRAEKGIIVCDEFDKISTVGTDIKEDLKQIMLKYIEGGIFPMEHQNKDYSIDTRLISKIFLGSFQNVFSSTKGSIGFGSTNIKKETGMFDLEKLYQETTFSKELISRIHHVIPYYELSNDMKRKVILESKISEYLLKKKRYKMQFGIELIGNDEYIDALIENLSLKDKSMRDLNNMISSSLLQAENAILRNKGKVKTLVLTGDTVTNPGIFELR